jgi:hypothetical protein
MNHAFGKGARGQLEAVIKQISQCMDLAWDNWLLGLIRDLAGNTSVLSCLTHSIQIIAVN